MMGSLGPVFVAAACEGHFSGAGHPEGAGRVRAIVERVRGVDPDWVAGEAGLDRVVVSPREGRALAEEADLDLGLGREVEKAAAGREAGSFNLAIIISTKERWFLYLIYLEALIFGPLGLTLT